MERGPPIDLHEGGDAGRFAAVVPLSKCWCDGAAQCNGGYHPYGKGVELGEGGSTATVFSILNYIFFDFFLSWRCHISLSFLLFLYFPFLVMALRFSF